VGVQHVSRCIPLPTDTEHVDKNLMTVWKLVSRYAAMRFRTLGHGTGHETNGTKVEIPFSSVETVILPVTELPESRC
jgi:hypothetical protein